MLVPTRRPERTLPVRVPGAPDAAWASGAGRGAPKAAGMVREPCPRAFLQWGQGALPTGQPRCGCRDGVRAGPRMGAQGLLQASPEESPTQISIERGEAPGFGAVGWFWRRDPVSSQPHRDPPPGLMGVRRQAGGPPLAQPLGSASAAGPGDIHLSPSQLSRPLAEPHYKGFPERSEVSRAAPPLPTVRTLTTHGVEGQMGVSSP